MSSVNIHPAVESVLYSKEKIQEVVQTVADQINADYKGVDELVVICILKGASLFTADLIRKLNAPVILEFMAVSSYGDSSKSSASPLDPLWNWPTGNCSYTAWFASRNWREACFGCGRHHWYRFDSQKVGGIVTNAWTGFHRLCHLPEETTHQFRGVLHQVCGYSNDGGFFCGRIRLGLRWYVILLAPKHSFLVEKYRELDYVGVLKPEVYQK